jgi:hypothetical protein
MKAIVGDPSRVVSQNQAIIVSGFVALLLLVFVVLTLSSHEWDPLAFVLERPEDIPVDQTWGVGYDGQQAYAIAKNPRNAAAQLDLPAYRYMRIIYPMTARIMALGLEGLIPWTLIAINLLAGIVTAWAMTNLTIERGGVVWAGALGILTFNYLIGIRMDLNEPLALCLAICGLYAYLRERFYASVFLFALAVLTKEIVYAFPLAVGIHEVLRSHFKRSLTLWLGSLVPYLIWSGIVSTWQGASPFGNNLARPLLLPFSGLKEVSGFESQIVIWLWLLLPACLMVILVAAKALKEFKSIMAVESILVLVNFVIIATLPAASWVDPLAVLRLGLGLLFAGVLWLNRYMPRGVYYGAAIFLPSLLMIFLIPGFLV